MTGNHEFYGGFDQSVRLLQEAGFRVLRDQWAEVRPGLLIAGVDDLTARRRYGQDGNFVEQALAGPGLIRMQSNSNGTHRLKWMSGSPKLSRMPQQQQS